MELLLLAIKEKQRLFEIGNPLVRLEELDNDAALAALCNIFFNIVTILLLF